MTTAADARDAAWANRSRYHPGAAGGFYESFFQRANHPSRPLAFWIRYTLFSPATRSADAIGELWAIYFDGENHRHVAVKREVAFARCGFDRSHFAVHIDDATLTDRSLVGGAARGGHHIAWDLRYDGHSAPLFLLPPAAYDARLPRAKSLVGLPFASYAGVIDVDGDRVDIASWIGSQNHNWGTRHTDWYAWSQVAGFDNAPESFLEMATARLKLGPLWTPAATLVVLRHAGQEFRLNGTAQGLRASAEVKYFTWTFHSATGDVSIEGSVQAAADAFVALRYLNPPGGTKFCLNSKIATCELRLSWRDGGQQRADKLTTTSRAAFEILTDDASHGLTPRV